MRWEIPTTITIELVGFGMAIAFPNIPQEVGFAIMAVGLLPLLWMVVQFFRKRLFSNVRPMPLLEIWKMADKYGWDFKEELNLHVLDFILALQQSGVRGELVFEGRENESRVEMITRNKPLQQIGANYWKKHTLEFSGIFVGKDGTSKDFVSDNYYFSSKPTKNTGVDQEEYYDLYVSGATSQWFKNVASAFIGRRVKQLEESKQKSRDGGAI